MYVLVWNNTKLTSWPRQHAENLIEFLKSKADKYDWQLNRRHKWSRGYLKGLSLAIFFFFKNLKLFSQQLNWILQQLKMVHFGILTMFTAFKLSVFCRLLLQGVTRMNMDCKLKHLGRRFKVVTAMPTKIIKLG